MTISNEAIAAATVAFFANIAKPGSWEAKESMRAALEAAAPIIRAEALEDAADDYRHYETPNARLYLRARAAAERGWQ